MDLGDPISYLTLEAGTAVLSRDGERVGEVAHVLADANVDVFDGIVIDMRSGPGGWRFADADLIDSIHEHGVLLSLNTRDAERLPEPSENAATMSADPSDTAPEDLGDKLRRAWDYISGRY
jgi:C-terminal processing protease CtpA/Prc